MRWNWQQPDWPRFTYDPVALRLQEDRFRHGAGVIAGMVAHLGSADREGLTVSLLTQEAIDSSAIEGEVLDRASVQSSVARHLGLQADRRRGSAAEAGAAKLMVDVYRTYRGPLDDAVLGRWHALLTQGRGDLADLGRYREGGDPMQIVSGALHAPTVHFEAPPSGTVGKEMAVFLRWFGATAPGAALPMGVLERAGIAHLWFESIHPYEDGNGRLGRAVAEKALAQGLDTPAITALAETIQRRRKAYYEALHRASRSNRIDDWLTWFADTAVEAQQRTIDRVRFLIAKAQLLGRVATRINARQEKALLRMFAEGIDGFKGGLSAGNYRTITDATTATATRDLAELVQLGALRKEGVLKHTRYYLAIEG